MLNKFFLAGNGDLSKIYISMLKICLLNYIMEDTKMNILNHSSSTIEDSVFIEESNY